MKKPFRKTDEHLKLMQFMSDEVGVDWAEAISQNPELAGKFRHASMTCNQCQSTFECVEWQTDRAGAVKDTTQQAPDFCLNKKMLKKLKEQLSE